MLATELWLTVAVVGTVIDTLALAWLKDGDRDAADGSDLSADNAHRGVGFENDVTRPPAFGDSR